MDKTGKLTLEKFRVAQLKELNVIKGGIQQANQNTNTRTKNTHAGNESTLKCLTIN